MFYIQIPDKVTAFHLLEDIVFTRLEYLEALYQEKTADFVGNIEYLLEGSDFDSIGHFLLRLFSSTSNEFFIYWLKREALFFKHRLKHLYPRQIYRLFRQIIENINAENKKDSVIDKTLINFSTFCLKKKVFSHIINIDHSDECEQFHIEVDFEVIPDLIKYRQVKMYKGHATIYCSQWREMLLSLFKTFINDRVYGKSLIRKNLDVLNDPRLISLNLRIQNSLSTKGLNHGYVTYDNIDVQASKFPLCMRNLHKILQERHRLSHHARFYYTLFLKECGMTIEDVTQYWKKEYSKPHLCGSVCTHNWKTDERKFVYSIRHMYGLEGNKKNYKAPSCDAICKNIPGSNFEGGCPFKNFDRKRLHQLLSSYISESQIVELLGDQRITNPQYTCKQFLMLSVNNIEQNFNFVSPIQYFNKSIEQN